jgi:hypothetical protein
MQRFRGGENRNSDTVKGRHSSIVALLMAGLSHVCMRISGTFANGHRVCPLEPLLCSPGTLYVEKARQFSPIKVSTSMQLVSPLVRK